MQYLSKIDYCVCEKTDGVRYLLLIYRVDSWFVISPSRISCILLIDDLNFSMFEM